ncbi:glycine cleavage system protein R [Maricurvus nonylphenolicus]|uniref:glycine cleavage system protein R n=1 Tax=Maricurvus nonylphenolicus TaxID=1008307 RepID=UPI0036F434C6
MNTYLVLTIISDDKPGVVETLSQTVADHQGNWMESRLTHLAGKFAGILRVNIDQAQKASLEQALAALSAQGIQVVVTEGEGEAAQANSETTQVIRFSLMGSDRQGIVKEIAQAFSSHKINVDELDTHCSSMPWSGEPMFTAQGLLSVPASVDIDELSEQLDEIADELGVDFELEAVSAEA